MRLKTVRLAGFKSFVEPTDVHLRARLTAVVGPNGCGKSNVVDAVRWVLGESSARQLRGGELADVIFNGSSARAPAGRASVELVFDNAEGRIAGPYARYTEVSVRRELVRDGDSHYSLNGSRCRRRDVVDLFLGTGLGPRSYAIIEQGMIARLVEARPEELRAHLEEVAGISRYRERRRETEARITDTRENLARLDDVRTEIAARLATLERQVKAAQRYGELRERERTLRAQHLALRLRAQRGDADAREQALSAALAAAGEGEAAAAAAEAALAGAQDHARTAMQALAQAQQAFYGAGAQVARAEQAHTQAREFETRLRADITRAQADTDHLRDQIARTGTRIAALDQAGGADAQALAAAQAAAAQAHAQVQAAEAALEQARAAQDQAERRRTALIGAQRGARARVQDLHERVARAQARLDRLAQEAAELDAGGWSARAADLDTAAASRRAAQTFADDALEQAEAAVETARNLAAGASTEVGTARTALAGLAGRLHSERATQRAALQGASALPAALADAPALVSVLRAEPAWRRALEAVLGPWLRARVVADAAAAARTLTDQRGLALVEPVVASAAATVADAAAELPDDALARQVGGPVAVAELTGDVRCAPDLDTALARRGDLPAGASYVTAQGHRVTRTGVALPPAQAEAGVLDRAAALEVLEAEHARAQDRLSAAEAAHAAARAQEQQAQAQLGPARSAARAARDALAECTAEQARVQAHGQRTQARAAALARERAELTDALAADTPRLERARADADQAQTALDALGPDDNDLAAARRAATDTLAACRQRLEDARRAVAAQEQAAAGRAAELRTLNASRADWQTQLGGAGERLAALQADLDALTAQQPALAQAVQDALAERQQAEAALADARRAQEHADHAAAQAAQARTRAEHALRDAHAALAGARAALGETHAREQGLLEQFRDAGLDAAVALETLPADADEAATRAALEEAERAIARLGAVNLAAPDEQRELAARAEYLAAQHDDLAQALTTLEQTMARMDRETRARFKDTFDAINDGFGRLFPRLFGGGEARLELAQDDPLDAGVLLVARPPGKRNASVHALSGGEKALTAIALVFALFELNPAPFCILDEVDAPLDEHNVVRFGELVRDMSARVQFVMITHNRATMEMAGELAGVTMSEPGVSRLVTVDLQQAEALAGATA